jgi:hypothetical protein
MTAATQVLVYASSCAWLFGTFYGAFDALGLQTRWSLLSIQKTVGGLMRFAANRLGGISINALRVGWDHVETARFVRLRLHHSHGYRAHAVAGKTADENSSIECVSYFRGLPYSDQDYDYVPPPSGLIGRSLVADNAVRCWQRCFASRQR